MGGCCCRTPDDDTNADETKPVKDDLNKSGTYGTNGNGNGVQDKPTKDRTVSFNESPGVGQDTLGSPADEASEAMPLLDGLDAGPADEASTLPEGGEPAITVTPDTSENPTADTEHKEDVSKEVIEPVPSPTSPKDRPTSMASITSDSSIGENLGSPTSDFVFSPEAATPEGEKKSKKSVGKKLKKGFGKFGRRKRGSSGGDSGSTSETSLMSSKSGSTLDAPK